MARGILWTMVVVLGLLAMVQQSMQARLRNPVHSLPRKIRQISNITFGLITNSASIERELFASGYFIPSLPESIAGRTFWPGQIYGADVIFTRTSGNPGIHAGITAQIMADHYNVDGYIHLTNAGSLNATLGTGFVSVPGRIGFTGSWTWQNDDSSNSDNNLVLGDYNLPEPGENSLENIVFNEIDIYQNGEIIQDYWINPSSDWLETAKGLPIFIPREIGLNASSSDTFVNNTAYRDFLYDSFNVSTADTTATAVALAATANDLKFISVQGISNTASGGPSDSELAARRVIIFANEFIGAVTLFPPPPPPPPPAAAAASDE